MNYEAAPLFLIFQAYFQEKDFFKLETEARTRGVSAEHWKKFLAYVGAFYSNMSNYHMSGAKQNKKFVPDLKQSAFKVILTSNPLYTDGSSFYKEMLDELYP